MKNIQAQYQDLLEGKMSKSNFMRNVRMQFPHYVSPVTSYDDSIKILKGKRILSENSMPTGMDRLNPSNIDFSDASIHASGPGEDYHLTDLYFKDTDTPLTDEEITEFARKYPQVVASKISDISDSNYQGWVGDNLEEGKKKPLREAKKPEGVYGHNPNAEMDEYRRIDHLNYYQVYKGIQFELAKMPEITDEAYIRARKKVVEKILKDPDAYKDLQLANFKAVKGMDKDLEMKAVKKDNLKDKPNEMKVVSKDAKGNTEATLEKKEARKSKTAKIPVMTQSPKGGLKAFETPGKEKVMALKEHILDEMTNINPTHEYIGKGARVKKKDNSKAGEVLEFDGDTATVKWDDGVTEHVQMNVLTKKDVPNPQAKSTENPYAKMPSLGELKHDFTNGGVNENSPIVDSTPKHKTIAQLMGPDFYLAKKPESQWDDKDYDLFNRLLKMAQETGKVPSMKSVTEDPVGQQAAGNPEEEAEMKAVKIKTLKEKLAKALKGEGFAVTTQNGTTISTGKNTAQGITQAREYERSTGDQLTVIDTKSGKKQQA
jgi:hypothetical protein